MHALEADWLLPVGDYITTGVIPQNPLCELMSALIRDPEDDVHYGNKIFHDIDTTTMSYHISLFYLVEYSSLVVTPRNTYIIQEMNEKYTSDV